MITLVVAWCLSIVGSNLAYAETVDYSVTISSSLNVTISANNIILNLNPNNHTFDNQDLSITVGTNNPTGYKLTMSSTSTDLVRDDSEDNKAATIPTLPTLAGGYDESTFIVNRWGYKNGASNNYFPLSSGGDIILQNYYSTNGDTATLGFASKIDQDQIAGSYSTVINFNAVASPLATYLQDLNPELCTAEPILAMDRRDQQEYYIARLADGNCWMIDNLRLGSVALTEPLSTMNTNMSPAVAFTLPESVSANFNKYDAPMINTTYADYIDSNNSKNWGSGSHKYGVYYNFCATTAGTYCYPSNSSVGNSEYDICPAGWRIPTGGPSGEYQALYTAYSSNTNNYRTALSLPLSGKIEGSTLDNRGSYGDYWSSVRYNGNNMYMMSLSNNQIGPQQTAIPRNNGYSIRCIRTS